MTLYEFSSKTYFLMEKKMFALFFEMLKCNLSLLHLTLLFHKTYVVNTQKNHVPRRRF